MYGWLPVQTLHVPQETRARSPLHSARKALRYSVAYSQVFYTYEYIYWNIYIYVYLRINRHIRGCVFLASNNKRVD